MADKFEVNGISGNSRLIFGITSFKGVDLREGQLLVDKEHGVDASNIVREDDVNQKRQGWEQLAKVEPYEYYVEENGSYTKKTNTTNFNGIWTYIGEDYKRYTFALIGRLLYRATYIGKNNSFLEIRVQPIVKTVTVGLEKYNVCVEFADKKVKAFVSNRRLYILGGNKYFVVKTTNGKISINEVEDDVDTYIPKTSTGVTYADSAAPNITALDDVNLLTQYRKNGLVSGTFFDDGVSLRTTRFWDWSLDASVNCKKATDINNIKIKISQLREVM